MTTWLWILGVTAVVWPVVVALAVRNEIDRVFGHNRQVLISAFAKDEERLRSLQGIIEGQDQLIAALWAKVYGYHPSKDEHFIHSWDLHPEEAYGICPGWIVKVYEESIRDESPGTLSRVEDYPWAR